MIICAFEIKPPYFYCTSLLLYVNIVPLRCILCNMHDFYANKRRKAEIFLCFVDCLSVFCCHGSGTIITYHETYTVSTTIQTLEFWVKHNDT